ncbi:hypothetical protein PR202_ga31609 [Eleusine coracana subsp. coracana]|uniref:Cupin 2 conserved barrel domain-containing protein n=1 Tax=Eleusine coracana subsp. coracana TaxID=191504 RepID=A0AAV5DT06_ELECO|nr:hypothetical protein PR202_ga31609 [Eleusine coracana subsp. coracana]
MAPPIHLLLLFLSILMASLRCGTAGGGEVEGFCSVQPSSECSGGQPLYWKATHPTLAPAHLQGAYLISPAIGAHFTMYLANMQDGSKSALPPKDVERYSAIEDYHPDLIVGSIDKQPLLEAPGEEVHYNQHGLLLLEGQGIYRLGDNWYPVQAGDTIWMAPFVPQWYAALGKTNTRYLLYKDVNRNPLI